MLKLLLIFFLPLKTGFITSADVVLTKVLKTFSAGETITLECTISNDHENYFSWFKQSLGHAPACILSLYAEASMPTLYGNFKNDKRLAAKKIRDSFNLTINDARESDTGIYYCGARDYDLITFSNGLFLKYKGSNTRYHHFIKQSLSGLDSSNLNEQKPKPGDSVNLQCSVFTESCAENHSVYWFSHESENTLPGLIYTHGNRNDQCKKSSKTDSHTQTCFYNLPKSNLSVTDSGIYYCAVAICGEILFGNGSRLEIGAPNFKSSGIDFKIPVLVVSNILCLVIIAVLLCKRTSKRNINLSEVTLPLHTTPCESAEEGVPEELSYAAVSFPGRKSNRHVTERITDTHVVYSTARGYR